MTASVLVFFLAMTQMHERYAYAALILPVLLLAEPRLRAWWLALSVVVTLNLVATIPATDWLARLPPTGPLAIVGALVMTGLGVWLFVELRRPQPGAATVPQHQTA
jgi:hypothetical protein